MNNKSSNNAKFIVLLLLLCQNTSVSLLVRYSRGILREEFNPAVVIMTTEFGKLFCSILALLYVSKTFSLYNLLISLKSGYLLWIPALIYFIQNSLSYIVFQNLDTGTAVVCQQMKILAAGFFTVTILRRSISLRKWRALCLLTLGVTLTILKPQDCDENNNKTVDGNINRFGLSTSMLIGLSAAMAQSLGSGFAGVYFEKVVKNVNSVEILGNSIWVKQYQLATYSFILSVVRILTIDDTLIVSNGLYHDFSIITILIVLLGMVGGILVAFVLKYADNIIKGYATCLAVVASTLLDCWIFGTPLTMNFGMGAIIVVISLLNYNEPEVVIETNPHEKVENV